MKRMLAVVLIAVLLLSIASSALAYDEEITWQDIPWGSSIEKIEQYVKKNYKGFSAEDIWGEILDNEGMPITAHNGDYNGKIRGYYAEISDKSMPEVAGYKIAVIGFIFVSDGNSTSLVSISLYPIKPDGKDAAFTDLSEKVKAVYGDEVNENKDFVTVLGENNTAISVKRSDSMMLIYGKTDAIEILNGVDTPAETTNPNSVDSKNTNGL